MNLLPLDPFVLAGFFKNSGWNLKQFPSTCRQVNTVHPIFSPSIPLELPVLIDGEHIITESVAIALYLGEKYPESNLVPTDLLLRAQLYRWLLFTATELEQPLWRIAHHTFIYPEELRLPAEIPLARQDFTSIAIVLENHLLDQQFVMGEHVTVADFVLAYTLDWANEVQLLATFPTLVDYMERMYKRPKAPQRIATALASIGQTPQ
jgi:glutathione S-transferase